MVKKSPAQIVEKSFFIKKQKVVCIQVLYVHLETTMCG
ncbi:hypothetical protein C1A50_1093 [Paenibacillus polymyxa]|nr:hypothetical protein C1A50_1093 [Paenibacillus polymyxa]